ncbi:MAG TPA: hypothetical protein VJK53_02515 [Candidatus Paceibacterota bacterium]
MALFRRREKRSSRPMEVLFYRDYIQSGAWELRKKQYYAKYAKACKICGDTAGVELNHIKYGNYGHERDRDLVPLCGDHHEQLHARIGVRGDMHYQTAYFLADEITKQRTLDREAQKMEIMPQRPYDTYAPSLFSSIDDTLDAAARPIWRFWYGIFRW